MSSPPRYGVRGEVAVLPLSQVPERFEPGSRLFADQGEDRPLVVASSRRHRARLLVSFEGVRDRDVAEALRGTYLFVPSSEAPPLPDGEYWTHELIGCEVFADDGRPLGRLQEVIHTPANDVWAVQGPHGEVLIPALQDVVAEVRLADRRIRVHDVPGLTSA